jgi:heptosyltransferase-1
MPSWSTSKSWWRVSSSTQPKRILIVRLSSLGDVIQTLPLPTVIRRSFPQARIGWAIDAELASAIAGHRDIDYIHCFARNRWRHNGLRPLRWPRLAREMRRFIDEIHSIGYDVAIDAHGLFISALIPYLARIGRRVGFAHRREFSQVFYTEKYISRDEYFASDRPHSEHMLALACAIGCEISQPKTHLPEVPYAQRDRIAMLLRAAFTSRGPLVAIAPATQWPSKQWPEQYWVELLRTISNQTAANMVLVGSKTDEKLARDLIRPLREEERARILNLAGRTTVPELYALLERVPVTIAADTAPLHVAGAARCAHLIGIYGPTPSGRTGPSGSADIVLLGAEPKLHCQPCRRPRCRYGTNQCMRDVTPAHVFAALTAALESLAATAADRQEM